MQRYIKEGSKDRIDKKSTSCVLVAGISTAIGQDFPQYSKMRLKYPNNDQEAHRDNYLDFVTLNPSHTSRFLKQFSRTGSTDPTRHEAEPQNRLQVPMSANKSVKGQAHQRHSPTSGFAGRIPRRIRNTLTPFTEEKVTRKKGPRKAPTTDKDTEVRNALSKLSDSGY